MAKGKRSRKKRRAPGVVLLSLILLIGSGYLVFTADQHFFALSKQLSGQNAVVSYNQDATFASGTAVFPLPGGIVRAEGGSLFLFDFEGTPLWEKQLNGRSVLIDGTSRQFVVAEPGNGDLYLVDYDGNIKARTFGLGQLDQVIYQKEGMLVCLLKKKGELVLLDGNLAEIKRIPLPEGDVLDVAVSKTKSLLAVSMFRMETDQYHSQIMTWTLDGKLIGVINKEASIILDMNIHADKLYVIYDDGISCYNQENEVVWTNEIKRKIHRIAVSAEGEIVLNVLKNELAEEQQPENALVYYDADGSRIREQAMDRRIQRMEFRYGNTVLYAEDRVSVLDSEGKMIRNEEVATAVQALTWLNQNQLGVLLPDKLVIYGVQ